MIFQVTILGCGAATPTARHSPTAQLVNLHDKYFLIDCGEGTQVQLRKFRLKMQRIQCIFVSHLHGDHFFGLIGLLSTYALLGRTAPLTIYGPPGLEQIIRLQLELSDSYFEYELNFVETVANGKNLLFEDETLRVYSFPLKHRVVTTGFLFEEKERPLNVRKSAIAEFKLLPSEILQLKKGCDVQRENEVIPVLGSTDKPEPAKRYAYCSDTAYLEAVIPHIENCDLLYHESTFLEADAERAKKTFHSTAMQAATIAKMANAKQLVIGHYSSRYSDDSAFLAEATSVFPATELANEGLQFNL
jgi:ribonuclease Z